MIKKAPKLKKTVESLWRLEKLILNSLDYDRVVQEIVDGVLFELGYLEMGYEIVVLTLIDEHKRNLKRVSISKTKKAQEALDKSPVPFKKILIPVRHKKNKLVKAYKNNRNYIARTWDKILEPSFSKEEALTIQKELGIKASLIYPVVSQNEPLGALIFSMSKDPKKVSKTEKDLIETFADIVGLAVQNASLFSQVEVAINDLKKANKHLRELDKLKDEFVYIATHELKTPVTVMKGYMSMIENGSFGAVPKSLKEPLNEINSANQQLQLLVNDLLDIARSEAKQLDVRTEPVDICNIIKDTVKNVKTLADQKGLKIKYLDHGQVKVMGDEDRLREISNNLLSNAIKYSEKGTIEISHTTEKDMVITHFKDEGHGISPESQKKIFSRFFRAEELADKAPGTGLGLFIVKQLVEKMGGRIWFSSKVGKGTTFSFSLKHAGE